MLKIRMQRVGRANMPSFRIVVVEHTASPKAGSFVEKVGTYDPKTKERALDAERVKYWMSVGAKPSATVHNMLVGLGAISGKKINVLPRKSPPKREGEPARAAEPAAQSAAGTPSTPEAAAAAPARE